MATQVNAIIQMTGTGLYIGATGIETGFLTINNGVISSEILSGLDVPFSSNIVVVGNYQNKLSSYSALKIQNGKVGIGVYPAEPVSSLQVYGGITTDAISGVPHNFTNSSLSNLNTNINKWCFSFLFFDNWNEHHIQLRKLV